MTGKAFRDLLFLSGLMLFTDLVVFIMGTEPMSKRQIIGMVLVAVIAVALPIWGWIRLRRSQKIEFGPIEADDPDDPMYDPAVQAMMREVIRTGRPMHMVRGQAPTFVDDDKPEVGPDDSVP